MARITRSELERRFNNLQAAIAENIEAINYGGCVLTHETLRPE